MDVVETTILGSSKMDINVSCLLEFQTFVGKMFFAILVSLIYFAPTTCFTPTPIDRFILTLNLIDYSGIVPMNPIESSRSATAMFAAGLKAYDKAVEEGVKHDCVQFATLASSFAMHHTFKAQLNFASKAALFDATLDIIIKEINCSTSRSEEARQIAIRATLDQLERLGPDEFFSFFYAQTDHPAVDVRVQGGSFYPQTNYPYHKMVCLEGADPKTLFPINPCPDPDSLQAKADYTQLFYYGCSNGAVCVDQKSAAQVETAKFWTLNPKQVDTYVTGNMKVLIFARELINRHATSVRQQLQYYTIISAAVTNALHAISNYQYHFNCWPVTSLMRNGIPGSGLPKNINWVSLVSSNTLESAGSYPSSFASAAFVAVAKELFRGKSQSLSVTSVVQPLPYPVRYYADLDDYLQDVYNGAIYGGTAYAFGLDAGKELAEKVALSTLRYMIAGQCPIVYSN